jgi:hypothetical protein
MDFNTAMAVAAKAEEDGDDVAADNMRAAIKEQDSNIKQAAMMNSEHEDWLRQIDVPYINACNDVEELHKISQTMEDEGFAGLMQCAPQTRGADRLVTDRMNAKGIEAEGIGKSNKSIRNRSQQTRRMRARET